LPEIAVFGDPMPGTAVGIAFRSLGFLLVILACGRRPRCAQPLLSRIPIQPQLLQYLLVQG
jgi:hypothetical protein